MEALKRAVWADLQRGLLEDDITARHRITRSQLRVVTAVLESDGLIAGHVACPRCGHLEPSAFAECPRCGVVVAKWAVRGMHKESAWALVCRYADAAWDWVDCGAYRWIMRFRKSWRGRV